MSMSYHLCEADRMEELLHLLEDEWCCLSCYAKFTAADLPVHLFNCPRCSGSNIHPINRPPIVVDEYHGIISARH